MHLSVGAQRPVGPRCNTSSHPPSSVLPLDVVGSIKRSGSPGVGCCMLADVETGAILLNSHSLSQSVRVYVVT